MNETCEARNDEAHLSVFGKLFPLFAVRRSARLGN
jgi:hypothetical protein